MTDAVTLRAALPTLSPHILSPSPRAMPNGEPTFSPRQVMETLAELLLLSEADVLVHAKSRFPLSALYLAPRCRQALRIDVGETTAKCAAVAATRHAVRRQAALLNQTCRPLASPRGGGTLASAGSANGFYTVTRELLASAGDWDASSISPP